MPIGIGTATAIGAGLGALGQGANMAFTGNMNKKNRRFAEKQYKQQREDQLEFWRMNNQYNHPSAQMERLREGGLNPHLMYGQGTSGLTSSMADTPQQAKWQGEPPQLDMGFATNALDQLYNLNAKKAQTDNLRSQNTLLRQDAILKALEGKEKVVDINTKSLGYDYDQQAFQRNLNKIDATIDNIRAQERSSIDSTNRANELQEGRLKDQKQTIEGKRLQNALKDEHLRLRKMGIEPGDQIYWRLMSKVFEVMEGIDKSGLNPFYQDWNPGYKLYKKFKE